MSKIKTQEEIISIFKEVHGDRYGYDNVEYKTMKTKVNITCRTHGDFLQVPYSHKRGAGCPICSPQTPTTEDAIIKFEKIHGDKYDYSKVIYEHCQKKICVICKEHGEFYITPQSHMRGNGGCRQCANSIISNHMIAPNGKSIKDLRPDLIRYLTDESDGDKYTVYSNRYIDLTCPDCGHRKLIQTHLFSRYKFSCDICSDNKSTPEKFGIALFNQLGIKYETQKRFDWSGRRRYDFFLNDSIIVEVNGMQHYKETNIGTKLEHQQASDEFKKNIAMSNGVINYIEIDCRYSDFDYLKENYIKELATIVDDFSIVNWDEVAEYLRYNLIHEVWNLWNNKSDTDMLKSIAKEVGLCTTTVIKYLKLGNELGKCTYVSRKQKK